ncbi:MAG: hypothetical protein SOY68_12680 [Fusobacterium varium]|nr:hypothetical protein [Fusobacterium varium]MDY4006758.1 hypothetical protein [Fusobacterium varium]
MFTDSFGIYILRASFTDKNGVTHHAKEKGKKCFKIYIKLFKKP